MADISQALRAESAVTFGVSAGLVYEIIAAACSSPQTTEINAGKRSGTLMKWVYIGLGQAALFVGIMAYMSSEPMAAILGGALAAAVMLGSYIHARQSGLSNPGQGTEQY